MNATPFRYTPIPPFSGGMPLIEDIRSENRTDGELTENGRPVARVSYNGRVWGMA